MFDIENQHERLIDLMTLFLGDPKKRSERHSQIAFDCPVCSAMKGVDSDGKGNLEINYEKGIYQCWACGESHGTRGRIYSLFKNFAEKDIVQKFIAGKFRFYGGDQEVDHEVEKDKLKLPEEFYPLAKNKKYGLLAPGLNYLHYRGVTDDIIEKYNIGFCLSGLYQNRVIIPSYDKDGDLNYFVSRSISPKTKVFKYLNPNVDKNDIIFNEKFINWDKAVFLVEGVFDHIVVPNSIALLGKNMSHKLYAELYKKANSLVIIALDPDAQENAKHIFNTLDAGRLRNKVLMNEMPEGYDISSFNQTYGGEELKKWLKTQNFKIND